MFFFFGGGVARDIIIKSPFLAGSPIFLFPGDQAMSSPPRFLGEDSKWLPHSKWGNDLQRVYGVWDGGDSCPHICYPRSTVHP